MKANGEDIKTIQELLRQLRGTDPLNIEQFRIRSS